jgi:hypothetical protein
MALRLVPSRSLLADDNGNVVGIRDANDDENHFFVFDGEPVDVIAFDIAPERDATSPGELSWNAAEGTLDLVMNGGAVIQQIGQETYYRVKNQTGSTLTNGTVVMATGAVGNSGHITVAPAVANGSVPAYYVMGLVTAEILDGADGLVTHFGVVRGVQTNGGDVSETWTDGTILWAHPTQPGKMTKTEPTAPAIKVPVAIVLKAGPSNGSLFVRPTHTGRLADLNDVVITNPQAGDVLTFNGTVWVNTAP